MSEYLDVAPAVISGESKAVEPGEGVVGCGLFLVFDVSDEFA